MSEAVKKKPGRPPADPNAPPKPRAGKHELFANKVNQVAKHLEKAAKGLVAMRGYLPKGKVREIPPQSTAATNSGTTSLQEIVENLMFEGSDDPTVETEIGLIWDLIDQVAELQELFTPESGYHLP